MKFDELIGSRIFSWIVICILVAFCVFVSSRAYAGGVRQDTEVTTGDNIGGTQTAENLTNIGGNEAYGFSHSLGDVDINQCLGSSAWGTILFSRQKLEPNLWCMAESYDARGLHKMAARMRCKIPVIAEDFTDPAQCIAENTITVEAPPPQPASIDDDELEALYARVSDLEGQRIAEAQKAEKAAQRARAAAQRAEQAQSQTIIQQEQFLNDDKRAALEALRSKK